MSEIHLNRDQFLELQKIGLGAFAPLAGFMVEDDFASVVSKLHLANGAFFPLPVYLDVPAGVAASIKGRPRVTLVFDNEAVGEMEPQSVFRFDREAAAREVFRVAEAAHPGAQRMLTGSDVAVGGPVKLFPAGEKLLFAEELTPAQAKAEFARRGWRTIAGFQTRNVPHRAHEYLQRVALEVCDGLFIQPLLGRKKAGDYAPEAVMAGYHALVGPFLSSRQVMLGVLSTAMRYAGPREAMFHALIRRNYGCTHFVIGRDHAGVGSYYGKYDGHALAKRYADELGIRILALHGPYHCAACDGIVTEQTCPHRETKPEAVTEISGTLMRRILLEQGKPQPALMRPEIVAAIARTRMFIAEDE